MTPDLSYAATGRAGESSARLTNGRSNKVQQQYSSGRIPIPDQPVTSRSRRSLLLLSVVGNIYGC